ncbi:glyoxalase [Thalassobaculum fulvum]|uniref:Glyoxalase n=1 Tax=Thalassobaculum fulvum TaxID=1633335 RepID=A0A919CR35_9PROT|nr:VOC family protein [Thalassobaculum fulvum]GHD51548.1 glyoxalase [Thalassobaculum fulvum]
MHKSRLGAVVIDCRTDDLDDATAFWTGALGYDVAPDQSDDRYVSLVGPGGEVKIILQKVEHDSRVHLDIETDDIEAEVERLVGLGAAIVARIKGWVVLEAPSGHRFCVVKPQRSDFAANATPHA